MIKLSYLFVFLFPFTPLYSQKNVSRFPGYVVMNSNDTLRVHIIITDHVNNIELSNLFNEVTYVDSAGNNITAGPENNISCFQFTNNGKNYFFEKLSLNDKKRNKYGFGLRIIHGHVSLYQFARSADLDYFKPTLNPNIPSGGKYTQRYIYYYLKKDDILSYVRTKATLKNVPGTIDKKWLKDYFSDNEELANKIGKQIQAFDLEAIVTEYNRGVKGN